MYSARYERGEIDEEKLNWAKCNACPSCGACSFIGTASTMQIMAEALGLALPGSALMPATSPDLLDFAREAGRQAVKLALTPGMKPSDIVTMESFENAILVHAAISGSTNCLLHIPAIAHEFGIEITGDTFDRLHRGAHYLLDVRPAGRWPAEVFLLCRRRSGDHGGDQGASPPGCDDRYRKDPGRESGGAEAERLL